MHETVTDTDMSFVPPRKESGSAPAVPAVARTSISHHIRALHIKVEHADVVHQDSEGPVCVMGGGLA